MVRYSKEFLLDELRRFKTENGRSPTYDDMRIKNGYPSVAAYERHFGKWSIALKLVGLESNANPTKEHLLNELRRFYSEHNKNPMLQDLKRYNGYPAGALYIKRFGSFYDALILAGLIPRIITKEFLILELKRFNIENDRIPRGYELNKKNGYPSISTYNDYFGGLYNALLAAELINIINYDRDFLISEINRFYNNFNKPPTVLDFRYNIEYPPVNEYIKEFSSWNDAIIAAGFTPNRCDNIQYDEYLCCNKCGKYINREAYWVNDKIVCKMCYSFNYRIEHPDIIAERRHKRRGFGYTPINNKFEGSNGHHLHLENSSDFVIYLPEFLHLLNTHNHENEETIVTPNALALDYWVNEDFYEKLFVGEDICL